MALIAHRVWGGNVAETSTLATAIEEVMRAGPLRSGKLMASGGCRYTEDRERFRGFPGSAAAELVITEAFS